MITVWRLQDSLFDRNVEKRKLKGELVAVERWVRLGGIRSLANLGKSESAHSRILGALLAAASPSLAAELVQLTRENGILWQSELWKKRVH